MSKKGRNTIEPASKRVKELLQSKASLPDHERMRLVALKQQGLETSPGLRSIRRKRKYVTEQLSKLGVQTQEV
ncbi:MAG: hypothetical protein WD603_00195 [Patescibacteria group bacterium]